MGVNVLDLSFRIPGQAVGWLDLISEPDADPILAGGAPFGIWNYDLGGGADPFFKYIMLPEYRSKRKGVERRR